MSLSYDPRTGEAVPGPAESSPEEIEAVVAAAAGAAGAVAAVPPEARARWLNAIATGLEVRADELAMLADEETALNTPGGTTPLSTPRQRGEDPPFTPLPGGTGTNRRTEYPPGLPPTGLGKAPLSTPGLPRPDIRRVQVPLGPCFGPTAIVAEYPDEQALYVWLNNLPGSLAAGVQGEEGDSALPGLGAELSRRCGRVVVNGWPTGVAVGWAQQHGGPWPATSTPAYSSVGAAALDRFTRPVAFQDAPDAALPPALRDANPWRLPRRVDGILTA